MGSGTIFVTSLYHILLSIFHLEFFNLHPRLSIMYQSSQFVHCDDLAYFLKDPNGIYKVTNPPELKLFIYGLAVLMKDYPLPLCLVTFLLSLVPHQLLHA